MTFLRVLMCLFGGAGILVSLSLLLGSLFGFLGTLTDTSLAENRMLGLKLAGIGLVCLIGGLFSFKFGMQIYVKQPDEQEQ